MRTSGEFHAADGFQRIPFSYEHSVSSAECHGRRTDRQGFDRSTGVFVALCGPRIACRPRAQGKLGEDEHRGARRRNRRPSRRHRPLSSLLQGRQGEPLMAELGRLQGLNGAFLPDSRGRHRRRRRRNHPVAHEEITQGRRTCGRAGADARGRRHCQQLGGQLPACEVQRRGFSRNRLLAHRNRRNHSRLGRPSHADQRPEGGSRLRRSSRRLLPLRPLHKPRIDACTARGRHGAAASGRPESDRSVPARSTLRPAVFNSASLRAAGAFRPVGGVELHGSPSHVGAVGSGNPLAGLGAVGPFGLPAVHAGGLRLPCSAAVWREPAGAALYAAAIWREPARAGVRTGAAHAAIWAAIKLPKPRCAAETAERPAAAVQQSAGSGQPTGALRSARGSSSPAASFFRSTAVQSTAVRTGTIRAGAEQRTHAKPACARPTDPTGAEPAYARAAERADAERTGASGASKRTVSSGNLPPKRTCSTS